MKNKKFFFIIALLLLASCTDPSIDHHKNQEPEFDLKELFIGERTGYGFIENWRGEIETTFTTKLYGHMEGSKLIIKQDFFYNNGDEDSRAVEVSFTDEDGYNATCEDLNEVAKGFKIGNAALFNYSLNLKEEKIIANVSVNEQIVQLNSDIIVSDLKLKKLGIQVGKVVMFLKKKNPGIESHAGYRKKKIAIG